MFHTGISSHVDWISEQSPSRTSEKGPTLSIRLLSPTWRSLDHPHPIKAFIHDDSSIQMIIYQLGIDEGSEDGARGREHGRGNFLRVFMPTTCREWAIGGLQSERGATNKRLLYTFPFLAVFLDTAMRLARYESPIQLQTCCRALDVEPDMCYGDRPKVEAAPKNPETR